MKTEEEKLGQEPAFPAESIDIVVERVSYNYIDEFGDEKIGYTDKHAKKIQNGMSKRFYAACAAMQGMLASPFDIKGGKSELIKMSFEYADELLKQE